MLNELLGIFSDVKKYANKMNQTLCEGTKTAEEFVVDIGGLMALIKKLECVVADSVYEEYKEFFENFYRFCKQCEEPLFLLEHVDDMASSLVLFEECMQKISHTYQKRVKKCVCCGEEVIYAPLPDYYTQMKERYGVTYKAHNETLSKDEYMCPVCYSSDRDRLIISYLKKIQIQKAAEERTKVLQIAPAKVIQRWLQRCCPHISYESTDLFMDGVTFKSDIQDMKTVEDKTYDLIICSHVLEHVRDDRRALAEMRRVLKDDGQVIFLVPIDLNADIIDEEWGCSESENWRRFGQGDHCRRYSKAGLMERLEEQFYVHSLGKEYFGEEVFRQCGLTDTSTLYVLTKDENVDLDMEEEMAIDKELCENGPLVSVVMSCYNHEAYVAEAIESVLGQSYKNIEFIVADDASKDGTAEVMKRYSQYYTKEIYFEDNGGGRSSFLNQYAKGKYIAYMHSDDIWEPDKLALQVQYMEEHEECGVCTTWCVYIDESMEEINNPVFIQKNKSQKEWMRYFWEKGNAICNPSSLVRRELRLRKLKYGADTYQLPDFFKWVDLIQLTSFHIVPRILTKMRRHSSSVSIESKVNVLRHALEEGNHWMWIVNDMENNFFKKVFADIMINPNAETREEIMCEKYFCLKNHRNMFVQNSAMIYLAGVWSEIKECMAERYHYNLIKVREDIVNINMAEFFE